MVWWLLNVFHPTGLRPNEFCTWGVVVFYLICFAISFLIDSDILTFLSCHYGKDPAKEFKDKVVWITGASSGIGEGIAKELSKCDGAKIVLSARRKDELDRVKRECIGVNGSLKTGSILVLPFDMTDYSSHEPSFKKVIETFGKLDVLISNAGRSQKALWHEIEPEVDKQLFDLNVFSLINLNRIVVKHFLQVGSGQLAIMSSLAGKIGAAHSSSYCGSKFALHGYFESLRNETAAKNISITMICPGPVFSDISRTAFAAQKGQVTNQVQKKSERRMTSERCGYLSLVAIANKLGESWVSPFPVISATYLATYQPYLLSKVANLVYSNGWDKFFVPKRDIPMLQK